MKSNKALYQEYRPQLFSQVAGQDNIIEVLHAQVRGGMPAHAYLFAGPRGTGKTSTARILAMALNCIRPKDGEPCLECDNCLAALSQNSMDIVEIDAASNNSVDNIRELRDKVGIAPAGAKYKVYIIDEVHMLSASAFNALLKTLEEPPGHVIFILATTELKKLPATVLSRCQRFDFTRISPEIITEVLEQIAKSMGATAEKDALERLAQMADGGLRDALVLLGKCLVTSNELTLERVSKALGLAGGVEFSKLSRAIIEYDGKTALYSIDKVLQAGVSSDSLILELLHRLNKEMNIAATKGNSDLARQMSRAIEILAEAELKLKYAGSPRIILEAAIVKIIYPSTLQAGEIDRIVALEKMVERQQSQIMECQSKLHTLEGVLNGSFNIKNVMNDADIEII